MRKACSFKIPVAVFFFILGLSGQAAHVEETTHVDRSIVFHAGSIEISAYAFNKNRTIFLKRIQETRSRPPSPEELNYWERLFRAQQVLIADANAKGYFERPEILSNLSAMERYMLTQPEGPFYSTLYPTNRVDEARLHRLTAIIQREMIVEGIRFDSRESAAAALGQDFLLMSTDEKLRRIRNAQDDPHAEFREGNIAWPCEPFADVAEQILSLKPDEWLETPSSTGPISFVFVHGINSQASPGRVPVNDHFSAAVREVDKLIIREQRRQKILQEAAFDWSADTAALLSKHLKSTVNEEGKFRENELTSFNETILGEFTWENQTVKITAGNWLQWFNGQLARRIPQTPRDIGQSVGNLVLERFDLKAAHIAGIDATDRYVEDRANFTRNLVLDLYEKEKLLPDILINELSVRSYYESHQSNFIRVNSIIAEKLEFPDESSAMAFLAHRSAKDSHPAQAALPIHQTNITVFLPEPEASDAYSNFVRSLITGPQGFIQGPFREQDRTIVMIRGADLTTEVLPLAKVAAGIRAQLQREALDAKELELAQKLEKLYPVRTNTSDALTDTLANVTGDLIR